MRPKLSAALLVVLGLVAGLLVAVATTAVERPSEALAVPAPTSPFPQCVVDEHGNEGLGCLPGDAKSIVSGTFAEGGSFTIDAGQLGLSACPTYVSTGCYYDVYTPSLFRCVYLHDNDPTDVRSCSGSLSTSGTVSAVRQGSCRGSLGSVYANGGPGDSAWTIRGPRTAACEYVVEGTGKIDNLRGPTFYLARASVDECIEPGGGYGCDEYWATLERHTGYAWLQVEGDLAPTAKFEVIPAGSDGLRFLFKNESVPFSTGSTSYEWDFGDGTTSTATSPTHTFESLGTKLVRLTMRSSEGPTRSATQWVELEPPDLSVIVYNPSAEFGPGKQGNRLNIGDEMTVKVKVRATDGVGHLDDVAPVDALLALPDQFEFVLAEPTDDPPTADPQRFRPGDAAEYDVTIRAVSPGRATIRSVWNGDDATGNTSGPWSGSFDVSVTGLKVEVLPDPESFKRDDTDGDGDIDEDDNHVDIEVKVTNVTTAPITGVSKGELLVTSKTDDELVQFTPISQPVDDPGTTEVDEGDYGDLGPGESKSLTWTYGADEALHVDVSMLVTGSAGGATVTALGESVVKAFDNVVLEARIAPGPNPSYASGKPIRMDGEFVNITDRPEAEEELTISFAAVPRFEEAPGSLSTEKLPLNGAGAYFGTGGRTPDGVEVFELGPGETANLRSIVETLQTDFPTGFTVEYQVVASVKEVAENGDVTWTELDELEIDVVEKDGYSARHKITLGAVPKEKEQTNFFSCDPEVLWTAEYIGCKLVRGVETAARGFGDLMQLGWQIAHGTVAAYGYVLGTTFEMLMQDANGRAAIAAEIAEEMVRLKNLGFKVLQGVDTEQIALLVPQMLDRAFTRIHNAWCGRTPQQQTTAPQPCDGDIEVFMGELAEIAGENIDMVFEALVAARGLAKVSRALAAGDGETATVISRLWAQRDQRALARANEVVARDGHRALPGSRVLPAGVDVTDTKAIWRDSYGLSERQFTALQILTKKYGVNITFRSRAPGSIRLIENNLALPKPQGIKTKGVNEIDVEFLGYHHDYADKVVHMEPPIPLQQTYEGVRDAARAYAVDVVTRKRPNLQPGSKEFNDLVGQVQERVITRHDEWGELTLEYTNALRPNKNGQPTGVKVDFDGDFNGAPGERLRYETNRQIELQPGRGGEGAGNRSVYEVKLQAPPGHPKAGEFLDVTGDVDFLAILKPDGTVLGANGDPAELAKRLQIYELMRANPINMQHGESFTIAVGAKTRAKYLADGVNAPGGETTLTMTPDQRLLTTYFDDGLSTLDLGDFTLRDAGQATVFFRGVFTELASPDRPWSRELVDQLVRSWRQFNAATVLFDVSLLDDFVLELAGKVEQFLSRDGDQVRPDGAGGLERYESGSSGAGSGSLVTDTLTVGSDAATSVLGELEAHLSALEQSGFDPDPAGALGGRWVPVEADEVLSNGTLSLAPYAYLATGATADQDELVLTTKEQLRLPASSDWFEVGDTVLIDPGGPQEERAVVASVSPFRLTAPLAHTHDALTMVILDPAELVAGPITPLSPARLVDTRSGKETVDGTLAGSGRIAGGTFLRVPVWNRGGVPASATAVVVNAVAVQPSGRGHLILFPCGKIPSTSSLNHPAGGATANSGLFALSSTGELCVFALTDTDLVLDVTAFVEGDATLPLQPARLIQTRERPTVDGEQSGVGRVVPGSTTKVTVAGRGAVPPDAAAVAVNLTSVNPSKRGHLILFPCDEDEPRVSAINFEAGETRANSAIVPLAADGSLCVSSVVETDFIVDVTAAFTSVPSFLPVTPGRFMDSRPGKETIDDLHEGTGRLRAGSTTAVKIAGRGAVPASSTAVAVNVAAVQPSERGHLVMWPCDEDKPRASSMNYEARRVVANGGVFKLSSEGELCVYAHTATDVIIDVNAAWTAS